MTNGAIAVSRRLFLCASTAVLAGCQTWPELPDKPDGVKRVGVVDTHVHLFNASDLPVAGFLKYTILHAWIDLPLVAAAIDLFTTVVKPFSITVDDELAALRRRTGGGPDSVSGERFADLATNRSLGFPPDAAKRSLAEAPLTRDLANGYDQLVALLLAGNTGDVERAAKVLSPGFAPDRAVTLQDRRARRDAFLSAARASGAGPAENKAAAARATSLFLGRKSAFLGQRSLSDADLAGIVDTVLRTVAWGFILMQPRSHHLQRYLKTYAAPDAAPVTLVNLLVDYDEWLDDRADPGSTLARQIDFWAIAAEHYKDKVTLKTFAAYCPLKHAMDRRRSGGEGTYLAELEGAFRGKRIAGLKFYPPMGFLPIGNRDLPDSAYIGSDGIKDLVIDSWRREGAQPLGPALDEALNATYAFCVRRGVPILAHAGPSNYPAKNFATRPDPAGWGRVAAKYPDLHVMLGHFVFNAQDFITVMNDGTVEREVWAITSTAKVLRQHPNVFVDLAYVNEILGRSEDSERLAEAFFQELRKWARTADPTLKQVTYGSDWIMLQREGDHRRYLEIMRREAKRADPGGRWSDRQIQQLFVDNAMRFLHPPAKEPFPT